MEKKDVVATVERAAELGGEAVLDAAGTRRLGGHSLRVLGAQYLAGRGIDIVLIQLMARWSSDVVLRYVADAPLVRIADAFKGGNSGSVLAKTVGDLVSQLAELRDCVLENKLKVQYLTEELSLAQARAAGPSREDVFIVNTASGKYHLPVVWTSDVPESDWRTPCGWEFGLQPFSSTHEPPANKKRLCGRCFNAEKRRRLYDDSATSTNSTNSS